MYLHCSDRLSEIKKLKYAQKPVTSQGNKENIDHFFGKIVRAQEQAASYASHGQENVPLNTDEVEEHRPERVVVEIEGLVQQRRVSDVLGTTFRRQLENVIRGTITRATTRNSPAPSRHAGSGSPNISNSTRPVPAPRRSLRSSPVSETQTTGTDQVHNLIENERERRDSLSSIRSSPSITSHQAPPQSFAPVPPALRFADDIRAPIPQRFERLVGYSAEEAQREDMVHEISELVHRRLVSDTLEGNFRGVLERRMEVSYPSDINSIQSEITRQITKIKLHFQSVTKWKKLS